MESQAHWYVYFLARAALGIILCFQGHDKIFVIKLQEVTETVLQGTRKKGIPDWFARISVFLSSYIEFIGGLLLILGLLTLPVLYILGIHLLLVILAFSYLEGLWNMQHVFYRFMLLIFLLLIPQQWNTLSLDNLLGF